MDKIQFSKYFTSRRKELGISINDIASVLNVSTAAVYKYEKGTSYPDLTILPLLAELFEVDLDSLLLCKNSLNNNYCSQYKFDINEFSSYFSFLRKFNNYTLTQLGELIDVQYQTISKWEKGEGLPTIEKLIKCASLFNVSVSDLYFAIGRKEKTVIKNESKKKKSKLWFLSIPIASVVAVIVCLVINYNPLPNKIISPAPENINIHTHFFEAFDPASKQEQSIIYVGNNIAPSLGLIYSNGLEEFEVYSSFNGDVISIAPFLNDTTWISIQYENIIFEYLSVVESYVEVGDKIKQGDVIANAGPILRGELPTIIGVYYRIKINDNYVNPEKAYLLTIDELITYSK